MKDPWVRFKSLFPCHRKPRICLVHGLSDKLESTCLPLIFHGALSTQLRPPQVQGKFNQLNLEFTSLLGGFWQRFEQASRSTPLIQRIGCLGQHPHCLNYLYSNQLNKFSIFFSRAKRGFPFKHRHKSCCKIELVSRNFRLQ
jgi:hypothetical protein